MVLLRGGMLDGVPAEGDGLVGTAGETAFALGQKSAFVRMFLAPMRVDVRDDVRHVVHVVVAHGLPHASHHARQHETFVVAELVERRLVGLHGGKDGGVAGHLRVVHGQFEMWPFRFRVRFDEAGGEPVAFGEAAQRVQVVVRDVLRVGARIRRQFFLIQGLQGGQGAGGGQAVQPAHVLLQSGQVVQAGRRVVLLLAFGLEDREGEVVRVDDPQQRLGVLPLVQSFAGQFPSAHRGDDLPVRSGHVAGDLPVAVHDHRECGRLHTSNGEPSVVDEAVGARRVHADQPVGLRTDHRRIGEPLVFRLVLHGREGVADGVLLQARDPQASHRLGDAGMLHDPTEDGLATVCWTGS